MTAAALLNTVRAHGMRVSSARRYVLDALLNADQPLTAEEIAAGADIASTYRNLETLETIGIVRHVHLGHGPGRYALSDAQRRLGDVRDLRPLDAPRTGRAWTASEPSCWRPRGSMRASDISPSSAAALTASNLWSR